MSTETAVKIDAKLVKELREKSGAPMGDCLKALQESKGDMEGAFDRMVPRDPKFRHAEGNSDSHIKTALCGSSETIWIENGELKLGRWQVIFFAEFDGPRRRELWVKIVPDALGSGG